MIEIDNMYEDLRSDEIGLAIFNFRKLPIWNKEKHNSKENLFEILIENKYVKSVSTRSKFRMCGGIGFSYLYLVPSKKRGRFKKYSSQLLRLVYVGSAKDYLEIRFGVVDQSQVGRSFNSFRPTINTVDFDPRRHYRFLLGEFLCNVKS
jgi:hypothetical protein